MNSLGAGTRTFSDNLVNSMDAPDVVATYVAWALIQYKDVILPV